MERRGVRFRGHSDTEVLLAVVAELGFVRALERLNGMFAIALWDALQRRLLLARDRLGEKPLYYGRSGGAFLFASELKAMRVHPAFAGEVDRGALALFLRHNFVPAPWSIYVGIRKLMPATWVEVDAHGRAGEPVPYWSVRETAERGIADPFTGSTQDATDELERALGEAARSRMVADVPLGAFLSGGVDSSTVVALMTKHSSRPVRTFSIGFHDAAYDEAPHARAVARHLGTDHTEMYVSAEEALAVVPLLPRIYDEPFADSSQVPTYLVSRLARQHVTVSLSGDGGDELFCGYDRYLLGRSVWNKLARVPRPLRRAAASSVHALPPRALEASSAVLRRALPGRFWPTRAVADRLYKAANLIAVGSQEELYLHLMSHWKRPEELLAAGSEPLTHLSDPEGWPSAGFTEAMMLQDLGMYLPDDILTKVDRASMAVSLEARVPLLDHRLVELAWRLPLAWKLRGGTGKWLLRRVLERHVPPALFERPKTGFGVPLEEWLRGPLREWAEASLDASRLRSGGYFEPEPIRAAWDAHLSGRSNFHYPLWDVLMFQGWLEEQSVSPEAAPARPRVEVSGVGGARARSVALASSADPTPAYAADAHQADVPS
jgi:asparagine synthase (glutamine-hydrolysing)